MIPLEMRLAAATEFWKCKSQRFRWKTLTAHQRNFNGAAGVVTSGVQIVPKQVGLLDFSVVGKSNQRGEYDGPEMVSNRLAA